jgi:biotin synthase
MRGEGLDRTSLIRAVELSREDPEGLFAGSDKVRRLHFGRRVSLCSIVPGRIGACSEDCHWCAQSAHNRCSVEAAKTPLDQIVQAGLEAGGQRAHRFSIVNSGRRPTPTEFREVLDALESLREKLGSGPQLCLSLGELTEAQARQLAQAGVRRYHHNLETSRGFFPQLVSTHSYDDRLATLRIARQAGLEICSGGLLGMGESWEDRIDLALTLRDEVSPQSVPLNFLHPIEGTPLGERDLMQPLEALRCIAIFRLAMPTTDIRIAGGRAVTLRSLQSWIFRAGATGLMVGNYLTTPGADAGADRRMIEDLGLVLE